MTNAITLAEQANSNKSIKIGITGSTGNLGKQLTQYLAAKNFSIRCLIRAQSSANSAYVSKAKNIEPVIGDILDRNSLIPFLKDLDVCIHLAALVDHASKNEYLITNVTGTENVCDIILETNRQCRLIYCSTIASLRLNKLFKPANTDYALSKYYAEQKVKDYSQKQGLKTTIIYCGLIYGPGDNKLVPGIIHNLASKRLKLVTGGEKNAPLIYLDDLCELFYQTVITADAVDKKLAGVQKLEIGIHDFIAQLAKQTGYPVPHTKLPKTLLLAIAIIWEALFKLLGIKKSPPLSKRVVDILSINFDAARYNLDTLPEWQPKVSVMEGITLTLDWCKKTNLVRSN